ncbi:DUF3885 domain-containing protein [Bacillus sp. AFS031507]|uniref:DUF3885 domain-containing protein n=1 Tax=Bacillus sp. AFS031507 TaxID=2033496 RepID=UPI000BFD0D2A|nr:DUF3885 domain-containing protein [Bacillus sp. AFS031507]PGY13199.1 hypothetical protein COE25_08565 [Bacillus sp. AFS031507]
MLLDEYLDRNFPNLPICPPLFYNWNIGIRFELGDPKEENDIKYMERVYKRALTLFKSINAKNDEIYLVSYDDRLIKKRFKNKYKTKFFTSYLQNKNDKYRIQINELPFQNPEEDEDNEWCTLRYTMKCKSKDLKILSLLNAYFNTNMARIFFVNLNKGAIFHIYDDRGCDLIASKIESIKNIYITYNDWILDYDREKIDKVFKDK